MSPDATLVPCHAQAHALTAGVAGLVVEELRSKSDHISDSHQNILARLQETSSNAEEVVQMKAYLHTCDAELAELQEGIDQELKGRLSLLETFHFALPDEAFAQTYATIAWPARVARMADAAAIRQEEDRMLFMDQLRQDRDTFAEELERWEGEIRAFNTLGDMADVEANS